MPSPKQNFLIVAAVLLAVFLLVDFNYFWANLKFSFVKPKIQTPVSSVSIKQAGVPNQLTIESLGIQAPIVYINKANEQVYQEALINGVVHFPGMAEPGQPGNCYIFGHSSDFLWSKGKYKTVFALLPRIEKGAEIIVTDKQGNKFVYTITESRKVAANDVSVLSQQDYKKKLLTLQTSYPVGTALARWIVVAEIKN